MIIKIRNREDYDYWRYALGSLAIEGNETAIRLLRRLKRVEP